MTYIIQFISLWNNFVILYVSLHISWCNVHVHGMYPTAWEVRVGRWKEPRGRDCTCNNRTIYYLVVRIYIWHEKWTAISSWGMIAGRALLGHAGRACFCVFSSVCLARLRKNHAHWVLRRLHVGINGPGRSRVQGALLHALIDAWILSQIFLAAKSGFKMQYVARSYENVSRFS